jgi:hypothetical protein
MKKTSQTILLTALILLIVALTKAYAQQPDQIGVAGFFHAEKGDSGNGASYGVIVQGEKKITKNFQAVGDIEFGTQLKKYRNQFGGFSRLSLTGRYWHKRVALELGAGLSGIYFADSKNTNDGYFKYSWKPILGVAAELGKGDVAITPNYRMFTRRSLYAGENSIVGLKKAQVDGWTSGHRFGVETSIPFEKDSKWLYGINFGVGRYTYRRNPSQYGAALGSVYHRYNVIEFSIGIARKL